MFSHLQDPVTDVAFVPMQIKPLILSLVLDMRQVKNQNCDYKLFPVLGRIMAAENTIPSAKQNG